MSTPRSDRELGLNRRIPRRDFLNGVAIGISGAYAAATVRSLDAMSMPASGARDAQAAAAVPYPPARSGLRGNYPSSVAAFAPMDAGVYRQFPPLDADTQEAYDLVIVGGGISGLAAAHFWRRALGDRQKILVLDNHDDFGGHAKRNEFEYQGRTFLSYGGTMSIATPYPYSYASKRLIEELGIQVERSAEFQNRDAFQKLNLGPSMFFDKEHFGEDTLVAGTGRIPWPEFIAKVPLPEPARRDLVRLYGKNPDYLAGKTADQKMALLARISWEEFLLRHAKVSPEAILFFRGQGGRNNKRVDTTPALEAARRGSVGFNGLGLTFAGEAFREASYTFHFPDGNASIARLLVARLVPAAFGGRAMTMDSVVKAPLDYGALDAAASPVRVRLESTVVRVQHDGAPEHATGVRVAYLRGGKVHGVRAANVILACYNAIIPALLPELPDAQKAALRYPAKVPMMYTNALLRRWTPFAKLGVQSVNSPCMLHTGMSLDAASTVGGYQGVTAPEEPIVVHMTSNPNKPGLPRREQNRAGAEQLLKTTFEEFEREVRGHLARALAGGGFDPAADIVGLTVNRWPYGYAYTYDSLGDPDVPPEERPHVVGRRRFGQVAIANSDAGAAAFTNQAIDEAHRAVEELFVKNGLT